MIGSISANNVRLTNDAVAVKLLDDAPRGRIIYVDNHRQPITRKGVVRYVGPNYKYKDDVKVGDTLLVSDLVGARVTINNEELVLYLSEDTPCKLEE